MYKNICFKNVRALKGYSSNSSSGKVSSDEKAIHLSMKSTFPTVFIYSLKAMLTHPQNVVLKEMVFYTLKLPFLVLSVLKDLDEPLISYALEHVCFHSFSSILKHLSEIALSISMKEIMRAVHSKVSLPLRKVNSSNSRCIFEWAPVTLLVFPSYVPWPSSLVFVDY